MMSNHSLKKILFALFLLGSAFLLFQRFYAIAQVLQLHPDERIYVNRGQFFDIYTRGDFSNKIWQSYLAYDYPILTGLLFGFTLKLYTGVPATTYMRKTHLLYDELTNDRYLLDVINTSCCSIQALPVGIQEIIKPIIIARNASVLLTTFSILLFFFIGRHIENWILGLILSGLSFYNPLFQSTMVTALGDAPLIFFLLTNFLLTLLFTTSLIKEKKVNGISFVCINIASGLAISTKMNGVISLIFFISILLLFFLLRQYSLKKLVSLILLSVAINFFVYFIINPYIWSSPITKSIYMIHYRIDFMHKLQRLPELSQLSLQSFPKRISVTLQKNILP